MNCTFFSCLLTIFSHRSKNISIQNIFDILECISGKCVFYIFFLKDVKFRWNSLLSFCSVCILLRPSFLSTTLCRINGWLYMCGCVRRTCISLSLMLNSRFLRLLFRPDLSLSSLLNSTPLICTRAPRRLSIRDPHQHMSAEKENRNDKKHTHVKYIAKNGYIHFTLNRFVFLFDGNKNTM